MRLGSVRKLVLILATVLVSAVTAVGAPPLNKAQQEQLAPTLVRAYDAGSTSFRVIVHVKAPPAARIPLTPRGVPYPRARLETIHNVLTTELGGLSSRLPAGQMKVHHVYRLQPAFAATVGRQGLRQLASDPNVTFVEEDLVLHAMTALGLPLIHADVLHNLGFTGTGTTVAIVDTGVDYNHPSLGGGPIPNSKIVFGLDTADDDDDPMDCGDHGTAVASIAAGLPYQWPDGKTFAGGVAPGAMIMAYKASPDGDNCDTFYTSDVVDAIDDAVNKRDTYNLVAINLSIGGTSSSGLCDYGNSDRLAYAKEINAASEAGIAVTAAAGNENDKSAIDVPACVSSAISVGSVYDIDVPGTLKYCGNDSCSETLCTDDFPPAKTVPCYSNSGKYLDLLAPSELLTAAKAGGEVTQDANGYGNFGGTSGATPYVTGSIALLHEAIPGLDAANARLLLETTGTPITDTNNITRPLIDLQAALNAGLTGLGEPTYVDIVPEDAQTGTATSQVTLVQAGVITALHVRVEIIHPDPSQLVVTLIAPDGTRVKLHDHTYVSGGLFALYPDEVTPAESLSTLFGKTAAGTWTLEVVDDSTVPTSVSGQQKLIGWSLQAITGSSVGPPQFANYVIPVGAHKPGFNTAFWSTDLRVLNPSSTSPAAFTVYAVPEGADGTTDYYGVQMSVAAGSIVSIPDLLASKFGLTDDQANILIQADGTPLVATSRTYNSGGPSGTYGQFVGAERGIDGIGAGDTGLVMLQLASNSSFHTNLGFSEVAGQSVQVRVTLHDGDSGAVIGTPTTYPLAAFSNSQINRVFPALGAGSSDNAYATVEVVSGNGRIEAYATAVDEVTGDAIYVPGTHPSSVTSQVVPIVASLHGNQTTFWVSDLRVLNGGSAAATVQIDFQPEVNSTGTAASITRTIDPGQELALDDIVSQIFGQSETKGSLHITRTSGSSPLLITSRTYNRGGAGTYGQFVPAVTSGFDGTTGVTVINLDKTANFRSNLGICEVGGGTVTVRYALKNSAGQTLGVKSVTLGPYQVLHINDIFADLGATQQANTRVDFFLDASSNGGAFTAYGTLVDNNSGDGIYVPAASYQTQ
ncbi:MAG: S8 family serine peptidase [Acidobacteria bacterium]|nr:S8 family serine peptidase [Acidobacteriota bacterium]